MNKKTKAALAGLAFLAGCEIGIAVQLAKMIHKFTVRESAMDAPLPDSEADDVPEDAEEAVTDVQDGVQSETPETDKENGESEGTERPAVNDEEPSA